MCGIHFVLTSDTYVKNADDFMHDAFLANQVRGTDSSGIFQLDKNKKHQTYKAAINASEFVDHKFAKDIMGNAVRCPVTVGHVRRATMGGINHNNAHPFVVKRTDGSELVGVHNGTLRDWSYKKFGEDHAVDSEWAFNIIAEEGIGAFKYFDGAYALVWHDTAAPDSLYMIRNDQRPLHFMITEDEKTILGASELGMLGWIAERNGFKMKKDSMFWLKPDLLYEFSLTEIGKYRTMEVPEYDKATGVYKAPPNFSHKQSRDLTHYSADRPNDYIDNDDMYGGDDDEWDVWGMRQSAHWPSMPVGTENKFDYVKKALKRARDKRENESVVVEPGDLDDPALQEGIEAAISEFNKNKNKTSDYELLIYHPSFIHSPNDGHATPKEIKTAKDRGIYGQVVVLEGIIHEPETAVLLGSFEVMEEDGSILTRDGEIRFITTKSSQAYMNPDTPQLVAVIGYNETVKGYPTILVAPLTAIQKKLIDRRLHNIKQKVN